EFIRVYVGNIRSINFIITNYIGNFNLSTLTDAIKRFFSKRKSETIQLESKKETFVGENHCVTFNSELFAEETFKDLHKKFAVIEIQSKFNRVNSPILPKVLFNPDAFSVNDKIYEVIFSNGPFALTVMGRATYFDDLYG